MAIAWLISKIYINDKENTITYLKNDNLNKFTEHEAIQKIKESLLVSTEEKILITRLKR